VAVRAGSGEAQEILRDDSELAVPGGIQPFRRQYQLRHAQSHEGYEYAEGTGRTFYGKPIESFVKIENRGMILPSATLHFVGWVEPVSGYVGFCFTQPDLHIVSSNAYCEAQQWPSLEPRSKSAMPAIRRFL